MRDLAEKAALSALCCLALVTATWNVEATQAGYRTAEAVREAEELSLLIAWKEWRYREATRTEQLVPLAEALYGTGDSDLHQSDRVPVLPALTGPPLAMGAP